MKSQAGRWSSLAVLLAGAFLPIFDFNVVNLALPSIRRSLGATSSEVQFVISAYAATYAVFLIIGGRLGDRFGRKRVFMIGVAGFTLSSALCGAAGSARMLIASRILQGFTATAMAPQVLASIRVLFSASDQGTALGLYAATFGLANVLGQILGGLIVSSAPFGMGWQAIFLVNVPIGLAVLGGSALVLRDTPSLEPTLRLDLGGVALLSVTLGLLVVPLVQGRDAGWPPWTFAMLLGSLAGLIAFVRFERRLVQRGGSPLVDLSLFRERGFAMGVAMAFLFYMLSGFYLTFSIYLQGGLHLGPRVAGLRMLPFASGYFLASFFAAAIMRRLGPRALTLGFAVQVIGFGATIFALPKTNVSLAVAGVGFGIVMPSVIKAVVGGIDPRHAGLASGIVISTFQIGAALGVAIVGGVFFSVLDAGDDAASYARAFSSALACNVGLLAIGGMLSLGLGAAQAKPNR